MSTEAQWSDSDNAHALGGAACTHQQEVQALQLQVKRLKVVIERFAAHRPNCDWHVTTSDDVCTCGYTAALADTPDPQKEPAK